MSGPGAQGVGESDEADVLEQRRSTDDDDRDPDAVVRDDVDVADALDQLRDAEQDDPEL